MDKKEYSQSIGDWALTLWGGIVCFILFIVLVLQYVFLRFPYFLYKKVKNFM